MAIDSLFPAERTPVVIEKLHPILDVAPLRGLWERFGVVVILGLTPPGCMMPPRSGLRNRLAARQLTRAGQGRPNPARRLTCVLELSASVG